MHTFKRLLCLVMAAALIVGLTACDADIFSFFNKGQAVDDVPVTAAPLPSSKPSDGADSEDESDAEPEVSDEPVTYESTSAALYDAILGEFNALYAQALNAEDISTRYALSAMAEAKLLESGIVVPALIDADYAISGIVPYTTPAGIANCAPQRTGTAIVCTTPIKNADRAALRELWQTLADDAAYREGAVTYLTEAGYSFKTDAVLPLNYAPTSWDILASDAGLAILSLTCDGLYGTDSHGNPIPMLASGYSVSEDGLTYTFTLREDAVWTDMDGNYLADVTADDFVAGFQHMLDSRSGLTYLAEDLILNAKAYAFLETDDFTSVGVKAVDEHTLVYTLTAPSDTFLTLLGYNIFSPLCRSFYEANGGKFGSAFEPDDEDYVYGLSPELIAYAGAYRVSSDEDGKLVLTRSEAYYGDKTQLLDVITYAADIGSYAGYSLLVGGQLDHCLLNAETYVSASAGDFTDAIFQTEADSSVSMLFLNVCRQQYHNFDSEDSLVSSLSDSLAAAANMALQNVHFRRALSYAFDRSAYAEGCFGEFKKTLSLRNSLTPGNLIRLEQDVSVQLGGKTVLFEAGTAYGAIVQAQLDADGSSLQVYDSETGSGDGFDGWYAHDKAVSEMKLAVSELAGSGLVIDEISPVYLEFAYNADDPLSVARAEAFKASVEALLGDFVVVELTPCADYYTWACAGLYTDYGSENNYNVYDDIYWSADIADPSAFLDSFLPDYDGYLVKFAGMY